MGGRVVILGSDDIDQHQVLTPVGFISRAEVIANVVDNLVNDRWIYRFPYQAYALWMTAILAASLWILLSFPQSTASVLLGFLALMLATLSVWVFDSAYVWIPLACPLIQLAVTVPVFLSHQLIYNERRTWRLEKERDNIFELEQLKDNFISLISHDLKTPIAKIQAIVDRQMVSGISEESSRDMKALRTASQELHRYIHSILQVSRVEARELKIRKSPTDVNVLVDRVAENLKALAEEKGSSVATDLEPLFAIDADAGLLTEVLLNLVENAIKYSGPGAVITVRSREVGDEVEVIVEDNGPGILESEQRQIWEKFYRGTTTMPTKGSGLGLYLVKYFVELHGGRVLLESESGKGTKIGFRLPLESLVDSVTEEPAPFQSQREIHG